jgi:hypothetical protein
MFLIVHTATFLLMGQERVVKKKERNGVVGVVLVILSVCCVGIVAPHTLPLRHSSRRRRSLYTNERFNRRPHHIARHTIAGGG